MNKFAFIIHPLELNDLTRKFGWAEKVPDPIIERFARMLPPFKVSHITGIRSVTGQEIEGYFVACPLTSEQMLTLPTETVIKKIVKAGKKAEELGAQIVGLGAFTSVVADKGITVARELNIPVTTGNSYTVATALEGTKIAAAKMGHDMEKVQVAIVGANGSIGRAVSILISEEVNNLKLVSRDINKLEELKNEIKSINPEISVDYSRDVSSVIKESEIIITASGSVNPLINPQDLKPGAVVCDVARPRDVAYKVGKMRDDILVIEGGIVEIPGPVNFNFNFGYPEKTAYACMAETMLLTLENKFVDYSLGPVIEIEKVKETITMASKHGFKLAGLRSFERALSEEKIEEIKKNACKNLVALC